MEYGGNDGGTGLKYKYPSPEPSPTPTPTGTASAPPPAAPPPPPQGSINVGGYNPDYQAALGGDPGYQAAQANAKRAQAQAAAQRKAALQQAFIQYGGGLPAGFKDEYGDIDAATLDQAKQNQFSTLSQLARNYDQNTEQFKRGLAARGALQSGDLNYGADQLQTSYGQQQYDAANAVGSQANQVIGGYQGVLQGNADSLTAAIQAAQANVYSNPANSPVAPSQANYDAHNSSAYGQPIYVDSSGNMYDQNGNPFSPPSASPSASPSGDGGGQVNYWTPGLQM